MEITGKLIKKLEVESGVSKAGNEWKKQAFVLETDNEYNNQVCITAFADKVKELDRLNVGDNVKISCNIYSREYKGKYYNQIDGYWFAKTGETTNAEEFVTTDDLPF